MSSIFPTSPAKVYIKLLPKNADFISYEFTDRSFKLKAWIPAGLYSFRMRLMVDRFYVQHCEGCGRNTADYIDDLYEDLEIGDDDDEIISLMRLDDECMVYWEGDSACENCPLGYELSDEITEEIQISNSVVVETVNYNNRYGNIFDAVSDAFNVHLRAGEFDEDGLIRSTRSLRAANVHDTGNVCWGNTNDYGKPKNLREAATTYFTSNFNSDLLNLSSFKENNRIIERHKERNLYEESKTDKFVCAGYDALMCIEAQQNVQAFYTMLMAGFRPLPELPNIMIIPVEESSIQKEDNFYFGYLTKPDTVGRQWYVSSEGYLLGQLDDSFVKVQ